MSVTQIPPRDPVAPSQPSEPRDLSDAQHWETAYRGFNPAAVPHLLIQLQDDLSRSRKREAVWLSVVLHLLVVILLVNSDKLLNLFPHRALVLPATIDLDKQKDATYLELPPDEQKLTRRPDAKVLSDKDRIATSKAPQINRKDLQKLLESARPGRPEPAHSELVQSRVDSPSITTLSPTRQMDSRTQRFFSRRTSFTVRVATTVSPMRTGALNFRVWPR